MSGRDNLFSVQQADVAGFKFDESVVAVFPDMIQRSVPGYATAVATSGMLAQRYATSGSRLYDLGCSLGASTQAMAQALMSENCEIKNCEIIAIDNSKAMLEKASTLLQQNEDSGVSVRLQEADVRDVAIDNASVVAMNYTLQFIPLNARKALLDNIYRGLNKGGVLILSEKLKFEDEAMNQLLIELHHDFKRSNGYSDLEVSQKRAAIEDVLVPESLAAHKERLIEAGFERVELWFQCFNFGSMIAFK